MWDSSYTFRSVLEDFVAVAHDEYPVAREFDRRCCFQRSVQAAFCRDEELGPRILELIRKLSRHVVGICASEDSTSHDCALDYDGEEDAIA